MQCERTWAIKKRLVGAAAGGLCNFFCRPLLQYILRLHFTHIHSKSLDGVRTPQLWKDRVALHFRLFLLRTKFEFAHRRKTLLFASQGNGKASVWA